MDGDIIVGALNDVECLVGEKDLEVDRLLRSSAIADRDNMLDVGVVDDVNDLGHLLGKRDNRFRLTVAE
ncbi:hypothetical protein C491_15337 [Natronococcus amylolyticus DSM 10524]|uniref:Uncharacterized protein n=1 Tax=Natronococcus amylolyticus DSM 10524 TaxID=1227497 RepID=L9X6U3_9EURY|nr:hypothetical protein C491_15337 [Natronococcus amylolyticus DSM 10524]